MSYRLINANILAEKYSEVNNMPCIYANLPNGLDGKGYDVIEWDKQEPRTGHWIRVTDIAGHLVWECDKCGWQQRFNTNFCPDCGAKMIEVSENKPKFAHISLAVIDGCKNLEDSYGDICVRCNECGRFNEDDVKENDNEVSN